MKRLALVLALLIPSQALAASSAMFSGSARPSRAYIAHFTTVAPGDLTVTMEVDKPAGKTYYFNVKYALPMGYAVYCDGTYSSPSVTCVIPNAPAADWEAYTFPTSGKLNVVVSVTGEL